MAVWRFEEAGVDYGQLLTGEYNFPVVLFSVFIACVAGYTALTVVDRMQQVEKAFQRYSWLAVGAIAMGLGIWAMHFSGMAAYKMGMQVEYSIPITILSGVPAIIVSALVLHLLNAASVSWQRTQLSAVCLAAGIGLMHYTGMEAMRMSSILKYDISYFILSIIVAHLLANLALYIKYFEFHEASVFKKYKNIITASIIGFSVSGMHYTAMAATRIYASDVLFPQDNLMSGDALIVSVYIISLLLLIMVISVAFVDKKIKKITADLISSQKHEKQSHSNLLYKQFSIDKVSDAIFWINSDSKFIDVNNTACQSLGYSREELLSMQVSDIDDGFPVNEWDKYWREWKKESTATFESKLKTKDGRKFPVEITISYFDYEGKENICAFVSDITERKKAEKILIDSEIRSRAWLEKSPVCTKIIDLDFNLQYMSSSGVEALNIEDINLYYGKAYPLDFYPESFKTKMVENMGKALETNETIKQEAAVVGLDGDELWFHSTIIPVKDEKGRNDYLMVLSLEITERKLLEDLKSDQQNILELISQNNTSLIEIFEAVIHTTEKQRHGVRATILYVHENTLQYGAAPSMPDAYNQLIDGVVIGPHSGSCGTAAYRKERVIVEDVAIDPLWAGFHELGEKYGFRACWSEPIFDSRGDVVATFALYHEKPCVPDVYEINLIDSMSRLVSIAIERKQTDEQMNFQASHDILTGLVNRREFERRAECLLSTMNKNKDEHALCFMDLDQFKVVNDSCGHTAGDEMLRQLGSLLSDTLRHSDTLARLGGDEFGVLIEHCSLEDAHRVASTLLTAIQNYQFIWEEQPFKVGVSIGLVVINEGTLNLSELLKQADAACYMAKDLGRNRIHVYQIEDTSMAQRHGEMQWVSRIHRAIEEDRFCLYAQSIVPLNNDPEIHYELLIRMIDEEGNTIPPGAFLPAAERYNLISTLDRWVVKNAFISLAEHPEFLKQVQFISINLSGPSLADESFKSFVIKLLGDTGNMGEKICFEITETAAISNLMKADQFIAELRQFGCSFALDDFGSGLSSFGYLKNLPVDYLKIDGMFVKDIFDDPIDHAMVKSINEIGHVMGMKTIAEFVENDVIKGMLREIGVDFGQGYGIHKPQAFDELLGRK